MADVNHDLFVKVLAQIEREPQRWNQRLYFGYTMCGTAHCFAGWALTIDGRHDPADLNIDSWAVGAQLLGIREVNVGAPYTHLFDGANTLDDLYAISAEHMGIDEQVLRDKVHAEVQS